MTDVKVEHKATLTRRQAADWFAHLASALAGDGPVELDLASSTVRLQVPDHVRCEAEVEVDGDEVELELELKWSTARPSVVVPRQAAEPADASTGAPVSP